YWRSFSKPVSGDGDTWGEAGAGVSADFCGVRLLEEPEQPVKSKAKIIGPAGRILLTTKPSQVFFDLLIPNVHDRAVRILVNDIKPAAQSRVVEKVVMRII